MWCDCHAAEWNSRTKFEYAAQAALCGEQVLLVNPFCAGPDAEDRAVGGAAWFKRGVIEAEAPAGSGGILLVQV